MADKPVRNMSMKEFETASDYKPTFFMDYGPEKQNCKGCGGSVFRSLVWNSGSGSWAQKRKGWGPFFCFNFCGHLNESGVPVSSSEVD